MRYNSGKRMADGRMPIAESTSIAILGDGAWGTAIAVLLAQHPRHRVTLWSARADNGRLLRQQRENVRLLPGVPIPPAVELTTDIQQAVAGADLWVAAIPTVYLRTTLARLASVIQSGPPVLSLAKGLENDTFLRPTEIVSQVLGVEKVAVLSGPSHAEETSRGLPASVVAASLDPELARWIQHMFSTERFRVYTNFDPVGVELAGALKNIIGIAAGISDGLGLGDNAKAALLTRGLVEMTRFGVALGGQAKTFAGLAGLGDLITTCVSAHGRNHRVGQRLARGESWGEIEASTTMVAEGAYTARSVHSRAAQMGIDMPITAEVYRVLYEKKDPRAAVAELMLREPKGEMEPL
jgi:glycerol-3-phosphate dehydrogenase (NAD(P)+)